MQFIYKQTIYPRIGFLGNPSDGFGGKTISIPFKNFSAEVVLWQSETIKFIHNKEDQDEFSCLDSLAETLDLSGYYGGIRLIKSAIRVFVQYCRIHNIKLDDKNFTISYRSNIPRQRGLAGSSAIIIATIKNLINFYNLKKVNFPPQILANIALEAEVGELGISAGLQDRVVQSYLKPLYMDFSPEAFAKNNGQFGNYHPIPKELFPKILIAYNSDMSESGKVHSNIRMRFEQNDPEVISAMQKFASFAKQGYISLKDKNLGDLFSLINQNFDLRRKTYGDKVVGSKNIAMIELARKLGGAVKFPGSGGAIMIVARKESDYQKIIKGFRKNNIEIFEAKL